MMEDFVRLFVPLYFVVYLFVAFGWRTYQVWRRTGHNPVVLTTADDAYGFVSSAFKVGIVAVLALVGVHTFAPSAAAWLVPIPYLEDARLQAVGLGLLVVSLVWIALAQAQMGLSWRIGIDQQRATPLVEAGLFRCSRNPIFLGMIASLVGLFFVYPTAASLVVLVAAYLMIAVQIRLEEAHLGHLHGDAYEDYRRRVRRWL